MRFDDVSYNFSVAKVLSILMVATGHFFGGLLWIPTSFGLFIFAFSSGFFTSRKYQGGFDKKKFWYAKIVRLSYPLLVINLFLLSVFLIQHRQHILSWQTIPSLFGMSGFLNWFGIANPSPFGAGLWFFTLLVIFYLVYPLLSRLNRNKTAALIFLCVSLVLTTYLNYHVIVGHMLWMTTFAFLLGTYWGVHGRPINAWVCFSVLTLLCLLFVVLNTVGEFKNSTYLKDLNYLFILAVSTSLVAYLLNKRLPDLMLKPVVLLSGSVIHIYFIHTYLFIHWKNLPPLVNYGLSMLVIISIAYLLGKLTDKISQPRATTKTLLADTLKN